MNPFELILAIVLIVTAAKVLQTSLRHRDPLRPAPDAEAVRLRGEVQQLKERIQVLERVITDTHGSADLTREIERLRDR